MNSARWGQARIGAVDGHTRDVALSPRDHGTCLRRAIIKTRTAACISDRPVSPGSSSCPGPPVSDAITGNRLLVMNTVRSGQALSWPFGVQACPFNDKDGRKSMPSVRNLVAGHAEPAQSKSAESDWTDSATDCILHYQFERFFREFQNNQVFDGDHSSSTTNPSFWESERFFESIFRFAAKVNG
jgi:hypothetical protein